MVENPGRRVTPINWNLYDEMCQQLAVIIHDTFPDIEYVYGIPRGGLPLAVRISHLLGLKLIIRKNLIKPKYTIIVDDISDTGSTLLNFCNSSACKTATLFIRVDSKFSPDITLSLVTDEWIEFPYETKVKWVEQRCKKKA